MMEGDSGSIPDADVELEPVEMPEVPDPKPQMRNVALEWWQGDVLMTWERGEEGVVNLAETADQLIVIFEDGVGGINKDKVDFWRITWEKVD